MSDLNGKRKRVLIVEDDMIISLVIENMVKELGHEVVGKATSGDEAIRLATEHVPDLVLMDIRLKGDMDGIEWCQPLKIASIHRLFISQETQIELITSVHAKRISSI